MLWFFERETESLSLKTLYDNDTSEFVVIVRYPDGREQTERFAQIDDFRSWLVMFKQNLEAQYWISQGGPIILPYGWPKEPLM